MTYAAYDCHRCGAPMTSVFFVDARGNEICRDCYDATRVPVPCSFCPAPTTADDSVPYREGRAHSGCLLRATNALKLERSATLIRRSGFKAAS